MCVVWSDVVWCAGCGGENYEAGEKYLTMTSRLICFSNPLHNIMRWLLKFLLARIVCKLFPLKDPRSTAWNEANDPAERAIPLFPSIENIFMEYFPGIFN